MSIKIRMTGSEDFGVLEIELDNDHASVGYLQSDDFKTLVGEAIAQQTLTAKALKASHGLTPNVVNEPTQPIAHPSGQTNVVPFQQPQQQAQPPAWAQPAQQGGGEVCDNSDGKSPAACGLALQPKQTRTGKNQLVCPQYRYSQGQGGNGHKVVWL